MKPHIIFIGTFVLLSFAAAGQRPATKKLDPAMYKTGVDIPLGVEHGTWDFDEWPGVDHPVVYKENFMYNAFPTEKIKIDYARSLFDEDDHLGYLRRPEELTAHGFGDLEQTLAAPRKGTLLGVFCHPDDEVLLAGGLLARAAALGWNVQVILLSNGADGAEGFLDQPDPNLGGYNSLGVDRSGKITIQTDRMGRRKLDIIAGYARSLDVPISVLTVDLMMEGRRVVQLGEAPGLDFERTFGPGTPARAVIQDSLTAIFSRLSPSILLTHGKDGEYGNYLHKMVHDLVLALSIDFEEQQVFTCFPEYNASDRITHFVDLDRNGGQARAAKFEALRGITFLYTTGQDFDKPWDPNDTLMDGAFVKDYGYTPVEGKPPRYEYFQRVK